MPNNLKVLPRLLRGLMSLWGGYEHIRWWRSPYCLCRPWKWPCTTQAPTIQGSIHPYWLRGEKDTPVYLGVRETFADVGATALEFFGIGEHKFPGKSFLDKLIWFLLDVVDGVIWGYRKIWRKDYRSVLSYYSSLFDVVEVNFTFYHIPNISIAEKWRQEVRSDFVFTVKVLPGLSHIWIGFPLISLEIWHLFILILWKKLDATILLFSFHQHSQRRIWIIWVLLKSFHDTAVRFAVEARNLSLEKRNEFAMETDTIPVIDPFTAIDSSFRPRVIHNTSYFRLHGSPPGKVMYGMTIQTVI